MIKQSICNCANMDRECKGETGSEIDSVCREATVFIESNGSENTAHSNTNNMRSPDPGEHLLLVSAAKRLVRSAMSDFIVRPLSSWRE